MKRRPFDLQRASGKVSERKGGAELGFASVQLSPSPRLRATRRDIMTGDKLLYNTTLVFHPCCPSAQLAS